MDYGCTVYVSQNGIRTELSVVLRTRPTDLHAWVSHDYFYWHSGRELVEDQRQWVKDMLVEVIERL